MKQIPRLARKAACGILCLSMLCTALPAEFSTLSAQAALTGDTNGDGTVSISDVVTLQKYLLQSGTLSTEGTANADMNADSKINGFDLAYLKRTLLTETPVSDGITIHLNDSGITVEGDTKGVTSVSGKVVTITASGNYTVDGSITDGQILVDIPDTTADADDVSLTLHQVTMTSSTGTPCLYTKSAAKTKLTLVGTSSFTDTAATANADTSGVLYSDSKFTVTKNSTGTLKVQSSMNIGIYATDNINLNGGSVIVSTDVDSTSDADAIKSKKRVTVDAASEEVEASADGIKSTKQNIEVVSGSVSVKAGNDAMQAATAIDVSGGSVVACGDRGFTLDDGGALNITGGTVLATATDYAFGQTADGTALNLDYSGSTQGIMQLAYAEEWKKGNEILVQNGSDSLSLTPIKKFDYVLLSSSNLDSSSTYQLYTGGTQMTHSGSTTGAFQMNGNPTGFTAVQALSGGSTTEDTVAASLTFTDSGVTAYNAAGTALDAPSNLTISNTTVTITQSSELSASGSCSNGQIVVNVDKTAEPEGLVTLNLEGLTLSNSSVAPIYVEAIGDEMQISAKSGTTNTISDGTTHTDTYVDSDGNTNTVNGAIFSRNDLKLKGKGTLNVNGNYEDGIVCKNDLKLWNGTIVVHAVDDGIRGKDSVRIGDPTATDYSNLKVTVNTNNGTSGGDGIKSTNDTDENSGYVTINGGTVSIQSYSDGIQAEQAFTMNRGDVTIETYSGHTFTGSASGGNSGNPWGGGMGGGGMDGNANKTDISAKGIKAVGLYSDEAKTTYVSGGDITINGGTLNIDSSDDSLHCAGTMQILGGDLKLASADDGIHSDTDVIIGSESDATNYTSPSVDISYSYEGVEGVTVTMNSGSVMVYSTDDGFNAAGGADSSGNSNPGGWGQGGWGGGSSSSSNDYKLTFNGGYTYVNAAGDGLDSNGDMFINGGYIFVSQTGGGNGPLDCGDNNNSINYTGGVLVAGGSSDMFETPSSYSFLTSSSLAAGSTVTFTDSNGTVLAPMPFANSSSKMVMSAPENSVTCYTGGTLSGTTYFPSSTSDANRSVVCGYGGTISGGTTVSASSGGGGGGCNW